MGATIHNPLYNLTRGHQACIRIASSRRIDQRGLADLPVGRTDHGHPKTSEREERHETVPQRRSGQCLSVKQGLPSSRDELRTPRGRSPFQVARAVADLVSEQVAKADEAPGWLEKVLGNVCTECPSRLRSVR
jgi:hypothetical protein